MIDRFLRFPAHSAPTSPQLLLAATWRSAALALALGVIVLLLARRPIEDPLWHGLGFDACAPPCIAGIALNETRLSQVTGLLRGNASLVFERVLLSTSQAVFWYLVPSEIVPGWNAPDTAFVRMNGVVYGQRASASPDIVVSTLRITVSLPLSAIHLRFGPPACVVSERDPLSGRVLFTAYWQYPEGIFYASLVVETPRLHLDARTYLIGTAAFSEADTPCAEAQPWRGFAPVRRYD
jgi:hypothetical protein